TLGIGRTVSVSPPPIVRSPGAAGEHPEIVTNSLGIAGTVTIPQAPARALPNRIAPDLGLDLAIAHAGIVVPRRIVGADVIEAEPVVVAKIEPGFRRAELATGNATGMVAWSRRGLRLRGEDWIEQQTSHFGASMGGRPVAGKDMAQLAPEGRPGLRQPHVPVL